MTRYAGGDSDHYKDTEVLINKLGIKDQEELEEAETAIALLAAFELALNPPKEGKSGPDFQFLLEIHRRLFEDIYPFAGKIRTVDISKGRTRFANCNFIESEGRRLTRQLADENWLSDLSAEQFAKRMSFYMGELNALHPFREGNGRSLREYVRYIAERAGHPITWEGVDRDEMINASIMAYNGDCERLEGILVRQIRAASQDDD